MNHERLKETSVDSEGHREAVGIIGLGAMGLPMALNVLTKRPQSTVVAYGRSASRLAPLQSAGAVIAESLSDLALHCRVILSVLPGLPELEGMLEGPDGILSGISQPSILVVCSSVDPQGLKTMAARLLEESNGLLTTVDAPVSGGVSGATSGTLAIMVGGDPVSVSRVLPVLSTLGTPVHLGALGAGQVAKACNQMVVAATIAALGEATVIASRSGLDVDQLLQVLSGGFAGSRLLTDKHSRLVERNYMPSGMAKYMVKDLESASTAAIDTDTYTPQLDVLRGIFTNLVANNLGEQDLAVIQKFIEDTPRGPAGSTAPVPER